MKFDLRVFHVMSCHVILEYLPTSYLSGPLFLVFEDSSFL